MIKKIKNKFQRIKTVKGFKLRTFAVMVTFAALAIFAVDSSALRKEDFTHMDPTKIKGGCKACHEMKSKGKGKENILRGGYVDLCLRCHGPSGLPEERAKSNIYNLLTKRSNHPIINTGKYHMPGEELPEKDPAMQRHVSCQDCHKTHVVRPDNKMDKIKGTALSGAKKMKAEKDSEVCYNCHSDSANLPMTSSNMRLEFDPSNASYHPVERVARGRSVSLYRNISQGSFITCSNCHESHGSDYPPLLKVNYTMTDGAENVYAYELCYKCHNRDSILSNQSFKGGVSSDYGHKEHIVYQRTSCYTCHASHGSTTNAHLLKFNPSIVTGPGLYIDLSGGRAQCNLTCHTKVHR